MTEQVFTDIYKINAWGSKESVSGPPSSLERTAELRVSLLSLFGDLEVQSVIDIGCGDWNWMQYVDLTDISYLGVDIVQPLIENLQKKYTNPNINFQKMNVLVDPAETADLWLARDFCCFYTPKEIQQFFQKFLESQSKFLAVTSIETRTPYQETLLGSWKPLNLLAAPLELPEPMAEYDDGQQWFKKKQLLVYNRQQILEWFAFKGSKIAVETPKPLRDKQDRNAHLVSNVSLRDVKLHAHTVPPK